MPSSLQGRRLFSSRKRRPARPRPAAVSALHAPRLLQHSASQRNQRQPASTPSSSAAAKSSASRVGALIMPRTATSAPTPATPPSRSATAAPKTSPPFAAKPTSSSPPSAGQVRHWRNGQARCRRHRRRHQSHRHRDLWRRGLCRRERNRLCHHSRPPRRRPNDDCHAAQQHPGGGAGPVGVISDLKSSQT